MKQKDHRPVVAIIGGGFCGAFCAAELAAKSPVSVSIIVIEPRALLGAGVAYSATSDAHRINVPASRMTIFPDKPANFDAWLRAGSTLAGDPAAEWHDGNAYPRREVFGRYIAALVEQNGSARPGVSIKHIRDMAVSAARDADGFRIGLAAGGTLAAEILVLAVSHPPPAPPSLVAALGDDSSIIVNPWVPGVLANIPAENDVAIIGTGLTMSDVVATLAMQNHRGHITAFSRRGQLSRGHAFTATPFVWFASHPAPATARALTRSIRQHISEARAEGLPWQTVLDDVRGNAKKLWDGLDIAEKRRLLRHLRPFWDSHRYRVAPQVEEVVAAKRDDGSLTILSASLRSVSKETSGFAMVVHPRMTPPDTAEAFIVQTIIVTTGPAHGTVLTQNPLLANLAAQGAIKAGALGLGLEVDANSRAVDLNNAVHPDIYVAGPLAREQFGELMGLPQVAVQPSMVATDISEHLLKLARGVV